MYAVVSSGSITRRSECITAVIVLLFASAIVGSAVAAAKRTPGKTRLSNTVEARPRDLKNIMSLLTLN
jgi:hypothetical protein